jgi:hypothetical protein
MSEDDKIMNDGTHLCQLMAAEEGDLSALVVTDDESDDGEVLGGSIQKTHV